MRKILERIRNLFSPKSVSYAHSKASSEEDILSASEITKEDLRIAYLTTPIIHRAINLRADFIISRGYQIVYPDKKSEEIIKTFLANIKRNSVFNLDFKMHLKNMIIDCDVFGNAYRRLIPNKNNTKIVALQPLHPLNMDFQRDDLGKIIFGEDNEPVGYQFRDETSTESTVTFDREEIVHLVFNLIGDEYLGIPLLLPVFRTIERLANIEYGLAQGILRHGTPLHKIKIGDPDHHPTPSDIDDVFQQVQGLSSKSEYVFPYWYDVETLDPKFPTNISNLPEYYLKLIVSATGIPAHILTGEEKAATRATAESLQRSMNLMLQPLQARIKSLVENQIFNRVLEKEGHTAEVELEWNEILPEADPKIGDRIKVLSETLVEGKPILFWDEAREMLKLPTKKSRSIAGRLTRSMLSASDNNLPGIYLVQKHAELIYFGRKTAIVKSVKYEKYIDVPVYLLGGNLAYGIIKLKKPIQIDLKDFDRLRSKHWITEEERELWWPDKNIFYFYPIEILELFDIPKKFKHEVGIQTWVKKVHLL